MALPMISRRPSNLKLPPAFAPVTAAGVPEPVPDTRTDPVLDATPDGMSVAELLMLDMRVVAVLDMDEPESLLPPPT